ncbi:MAG: hypothetical protein JJU28_03520 [Cyclobacteriaceae bacterium]|nr:hypothetical protein [Cyclobacteriaceae bacterium]
MKTTFWLTQTLFLTLVGFQFASAQSNSIEVFYFHTTNRCFTCKAIEMHSKKTIDMHFANVNSSKATVKYHAFNLDNPDNKHLREEFKAFGSSLYLRVNNGENSEIVDLTRFGFMNARNEEKFISGLKAEIDKQLPAL